MRIFGALLAAFATLATFSAQAADSSLSLEANAAFLAANSHKPGVVTRPSGLEYKILQNGYGRHPAATDDVLVYYTGSLINGQVFDGTEPGLPISFKANQLITGWTEALQLMREGDHWQVFIPSNLAYGTRGAGTSIPPNQALVFDLQLIKVSTPKAEPKDPKEEETSPGNGAE